MPTDAALPHDVDRRSTSIDEAVAFYERVYDSPDINVGRAVPDGFSWRYRAVGDDEVTVGTSSVGANRWGTVGQGTGYVLAWATAPGLTLDSASRDPLQMQPGVPVMYPVGRDFAFEALPTTQHLIRFDSGFLEAVAAARRATVPGPLTFTNTTDAAHLEHLRGLIRAAAPELLDPGTDRDRRAALNMLVAESVVDAYDAAPKVDVALFEGPATMRFAQEWMIANAHRPITGTDVARAAGVKARALQATFQRHADTTPMAFLRQVRLHRVRAQLVAGDPTTTTVAATAGAWGFAHLGRFAAFYAESFGERPSETLRRVQRLG